MTTFTGNHLLYELLYFDRELILKGQVWRLITYPLTYDAGSILLTAITLLCYYSLGRAIENQWGTLRFNLYYLSGVLLMDIYSMVFGGWADVSYLNLSLFLASSESSGSMRLRRPLMFSFSQMSRMMSIYPGSEIGGTI